MLENITEFLLYLKDKYFPRKKFLEEVYKNKIKPYISEISPLILPYPSVLYLFTIAIKLDKEYIVKKFSGYALGHIYLSSSLRDGSFQVGYDMYLDYDDLGKLDIHLKEKKRAFVIYFDFTRELDTDKDIIYIGLGRKLIRDMELIEQIRIPPTNVYEVIRTFENAESFALAIQEARKIVEQERIFEDISEAEERGRIVRISPAIEPILPQISIAFPQVLSSLLDYFLFLSSLKEVM